MKFQWGLCIDWRRITAMTMTDAIVRLIPGVLGNEQSHQDDSFSDGLLEFPQYTRPREYKGMTVPDVLLSGNHANIENGDMNKN